MRIISLVPSITELLFDLELDHEVVGLTKFCIHPRDRWKSLPRVGGTKNVNHELIQRLKPDLIIANHEENTREDVEKLQTNYHVHVTRVSSVQSAFDMILEVGGLTGRMVEAKKLVDHISSSWQSVKGTVKGEKVVYAIWENPLMVAGNDTYIHAVLEWFGWKNVINKTRYPELSKDELSQLAPERFMLSSEPFPFNDEHVLKYSKELPEGKVEKVDGEMFSWYGSRMKLVPDYIRTLR